MVKSSEVIKGQNGLFGENQFSQTTFRLKGYTISREHFVFFSTQVTNSQHDAIASRAVIRDSVSGGQMRV